MCGPERSGLAGLTRTEQPADSALIEPEPEGVAAASCRCFLLSPKFVTMQVVSHTSTDLVPVPRNLRTNRGTAEGLYHALLDISGRCLQAYYVLCLVRAARALDNQIDMPMRA